jgi:hypothetical protein
MRGIAIPKRINYIFQKKSLIIFYFLSILFFIFLKKKKKTFTVAGWGGRPTTYGARGGRTTPDSHRGWPGHPLVFNFFFFKKKKLII